MNRIIEQIRSEVERRKNICRKAGDVIRVDYYMGKGDAYEELLSFLSTLQEKSEKPINPKEQSDKGLDVTDFSKPLAPEVAKCIADHWFEMDDKEPVCEDAYIKRLHEKRILPTLKGEIKHKFRNEYNTILQTLGLIPLLSPYDVARKRLEEMCLAFASWGFYNLHLERREHHPDNPVCEGLEEEYKDYVENDPVYSKLVNGIVGLSIARHFAQWQKEKDEREKVFLDGVRQSYDNTIQHLEERMNERYEQGKKDMKEQMMREKQHDEFKSNVEQEFLNLSSYEYIVKCALDGVTRLGSLCDDKAIIDAAKLCVEKLNEQMMKEAVEGVICGDNAKLWICNNPPSFILDKFKDGDKVKLVFTKGD